MTSNTDQLECLVCFEKSDKPICKECRKWLNAVDRELVKYEMENLVT